MLASEAGPRYRHDCQSCAFLGRYEIADLYFCYESGGPIVIARYSSEPADFASGLKQAEREFKQCMMEQLPLTLLGEAYRRALRGGFKVLRRREDWSKDDDEPEP